MRDPVRYLRWSFLAALVASPLALSPAAYGQTGENKGGYQQPPPEPEQPTQQPPAQQPLAMEVDGATLDRFAKAVVELRSIQTSASMEMDQVVNGAEIGEIQLRMQQEMTSAIEDAGLSVEEYYQIAELMNSDPQIRASVMERLNPKEGE